MQLIVPTVIGAPSPRKNTARRRAPTAFLAGVIVLGAQTAQAEYIEPVVNRVLEEYREAQRQQSPDETSVGITNIQLNPGGNVSVAGSFVHEDTGTWTRKGAMVDYFAVGATTRSASPSAYAMIDFELIEAGRGATHRSGSAYADLTYFVSIRPDPDSLLSEGIWSDVVVPVEMVSFAFKSVDPGGDAVGTLELFNRATNESLITYTTYEDSSIASNSDDALERRYTLDNGVWVYDTLEVRLTAEAIAVVDNSIDPDAVTTSRSEVYIDPYFLFDQDAYDARRLLDPSLPEVQLADALTFEVSSNIYEAPAPVPVPATWLLLSPAIGMIAVAMKRRPD